MGVIAIFISVYAGALFDKNNSHSYSLPTKYIKNTKVSFLGLGTVALGRDWGIAGENSLHPSEDLTKDVLQTALKSGMTVIDTASSYGLSEERIGRYVPRSANHYLLITKAGEHSIKANDPRCKKPAYDHVYCAKPAAQYDFSYKAILKDVNESLKKLKVDKIDVVLLHLENKTAEDVLQKAEAIRALEELKRMGKVNYIGVSINGITAKHAIETHKFDVIELEYSLLNQSNKEYIDFAYQQGMGVIVRGGLGTGLLTAYVARHIDDPKLPYGPQIRALLKLTHNNYDQITALALAFLYQDPHISSVIIGADRPVFITKDINLFKNFKDRKMLEKAKNILREYKTPAVFTDSMGEYYQYKS